MRVRPHRDALRRQLDRWLRAAGIQADPSFTFPAPRRVPPAVPAPAALPSPPQPPAGWRALLSEDIPAKRFWEGVLEEITLVIEASGEDALSSRRIFDGLPHRVAARFADFKGGDNKVFLEKLAAWAWEGTRLRLREDGLYGLARSN